MSKTTNGAGGFAPREVGPEGGTPKGQHTPGPWTVAGDVKGQEAWCPTRHIYASADREAHGSGCVATVASSRANARLIAAAPTMYEFLASKAGSGDTEASRILESIHGRAERNNPLERR